MSLRHDVVVLGSPASSAVGRDMLEDFSAQLRADRHQLVVVDAATNLTGLSALPCRTVALALPAPGAEGVQAFADELSAQLEGPCLVFSGFEDLQELVAEVSACWGLRHNSADVGRVVRHKDLCREALRAAGLRQPRVSLVNSAPELSAAVSDVGLPCVVKPRTGRGSTDVILVEESADVEEVAGRMARYHEAGYLVEEFIDGTEFSIEGVFVAEQPQVLAVTRKELLGRPPYFVEIGHVQPPGLPLGEEGALRTAADRALTVLGAKVGLFHVEAWLTRHGVVVGEVHLRPGGDWIHVLCGSTRPDRPMFGTLVEDLCGPGAAVQADVPAAGSAAVRFFTAQPGVVREIRFWDQVSRAEGVVRSHRLLAPGETAEVTTDSNQRAGVFVVASPDGRAAEIVQELCDVVQVVTSG